VAEIPKFNAAGADGRAALDPTGQPINVYVGPPSVHGYEFSPPGTDWTISRVTGLGPRVVVWDWMVRAQDETTLNSTELGIESYLTSHAPYNLDDGKGRSGPAVLADAQRIGPRLTTTDGRKLQRWRLTFRVLQPTFVTGAL